ncbi:hypothetical protein Dvar_68260 [Desulfosarcina variabilis str. Montpellier]|uniref:hypothetical protein n=1 Tax=Desulfosarcina variabilis TaxID=2300 RepID=UPI003AFAB79A
MRRLSIIIGLILAMLIAAASICHADSAISYPLVESPDGSEHILALQNPTSNQWRIIRIPSSEFEGEGGSQDYTEIIAALNEQGIYPGEIVFTTTGSAFAPTIVLNGAATVEWTFSDGTTSDSTTPTVDFGSASTRQQRLKVTPWANLYRINIGYAGADGGASTDALGNTFEQVASQPVTAITNLDLVQDSLVYLAACGCPITSLDVRNFTALHTLEFYDCDDLVAADIYGTSNLRRACFEHSPVGFLDFSASPLMEDVRGSYCDLTEIRWGTTGQHLWHMCVRENDGTLDPSTWPDMEQFPVLEDMWISGNGLTGDLSITSTSITSAWLYDNDFSTIDLSGAFPSGTHYVDAYDNPNCTTITIDNCPGLTELDASGCALTQTNIDYILATLDANGASNGEVDLSGGTSSSPSTAGLTSQANLEGKGWTVTVNGSATPNLSSAAIGSDGTTWTLVFSEAVTIGSGGSGGFSVTMTNAGAITLTYSSGDGTSTLVYTGDVTVQSGDTVSSGLDYTQPGDGIEDADGNDLATFTGASVSNNSTQGASSSLSIVQYNRTTDFSSAEGSLDAPAMTFTAGNVVAVFAACYSGSVTGISDTEGNTYTAISGTSVTNQVHGVWYYAVASTSNENTVTMANSGRYRSIEVFELSGVDTSNPIDVTGTLSSENEISYTTSAANEILLIGGHNDYGGACYVTEDWTWLYDGESTFGRPVAYKINSATESSSVTLSTDGTLWIQSLVGFVGTTQ